MQKLFFILLLSVTCTLGLAQWEADTVIEGNRRAVMAAREEGRRQEGVTITQIPWFFGGGILAGFSNYGSAFGISPLVGYRLNDYVDAGLGVNFIYNSTRPRYWDGTATGDKYRSFNFGLVPFVRAFPIENIFTQLQFEQAWVTGNMVSGGQKNKYNYNYQSLIASLGYAQRIGGRVGFYFSVGIDLLNNPNSPYRDANGRVKPVLGTGINF